MRFALLNEQAVLLIMGKVDQEGRFELTTRKGRQQGSGAPEGSYRVTYSPPQLGKNSLPVTSEQTYKVEARSNQFTFETGGGQPF